MLLYLRDSLFKQVYVLPHWDRSCRSNFLPHPVTVSDTGPTSPSTDPISPGMNQGRWNGVVLLLGLSGKGWYKKKQSSSETRKTGEWQVSTMATCPAGERKSVYPWTSWVTWQLTQWSCGAENNIIHHRFSTISCPTQHHRFSTISCPTQSHIHRSIHFCWLLQQNNWNYSLKITFNKKSKSSNYPYLPCCYQSSLQLSP